MGVVFDEETGARQWPTVFVMQCVDTGALPGMLERIKEDSGVCRGNRH